MRSSILLRSLCLLPFLLEAGAQDVSVSREPTTPQISDIQRKSLNELANDLAQLDRYRTANESAGAHAAQRVVFFGDSLTEGWGMARNGSVFFPGKGYLNRGISGQTTLQMLIRFRQDVIDLHPSVVLILGGTNDVAGNMGPASVKSITDNLQSMVELAQAHGIRVVLCSELPAAQYRWRTDVNPVPVLLELNRWLRSYAAAHRLGYVDYYSVLDDGHGGLKSELTWDGVHPNAAGYRQMAPLAEAAIATALRSKP